MSELPKKTRPPKDSERRARILAKARELFLEHGFQVVSVEQHRGRGRGFQSNGFSAIFPTKEELLWAIIREEGEAMRPMFPEQLPENAGEFREGLVALGRGLLACSRLHISFSWVI